MTVYALAELKIHDRGGYDRYAARFAESLRPFDGRLLAADERPQTIEGDWTYDKVVLIEFRDEETFRTWASSELYTEIAVDRVASTTGTVLLVRGV